MKTYIIQTIRLTFICLIFFSGIYTVLVWGMAQASSDHGNGRLAISNNNAVGYEQIGQAFDADKYFWSRPSAVNYNAAGSGGSNKGPSNEEYLQQVQARIDTFLVHNPVIKKWQIPAELVTASGSGLDPNLSPEAVRIQVYRISSARHIAPDKIDALVDKFIEEPLWGVLGPVKVNVLRLNIELDNLSK